MVEAAARNVLVLGATGMLGHMVYRVLADAAPGHAFGSVRSADACRFFKPVHAGGLMEVGDLEDIAQLTKLLDAVQPQVVINCLSLAKHLHADPMRAMSMLAVLPQRLSRLCQPRGARLIQISSDGVFTGSKGGYTEDDLPDATDVYGVAKQLGEVREPHTLSLRTSIIGPELQSGTGLLAWFLSQQHECRSYTGAIFSGFPTVVLAELIRDAILPRSDLAGVYHVATAPISKFDLMGLIAGRYGKEIRLIPDGKIAVDRSLRTDKFKKATGYEPPLWPELVDRLYSSHSELART